MGQIVTGNFKLLFPSKYINEADLKERDVTVLIDRVERCSLKMTNGKSETKAVLFMKSAAGKPLGKALVLNKTNATAIASIHGNKVEAWRDKPITLFPTVCEAFGKPNTPCVRIRPKVGKPGDWIILGVKGEIYPCKPEIFAETYEPVIE